MDELASALRPYQVRFGEYHAVLQGMLAGAALGETLSGKLGIEHVLSALPVLDAHLAESAVQFLCRHAQLLGELGGGDAGDGVEHLVGIFGTRLQLGNLFVASLQGGLHDFDGTQHDVLVAVALLGHHVSALLADGRQHFAGDPTLESLGAFELRRKD